MAGSASTSGILVSTQRQLEMDNCIRDMPSQSVITTLLTTEHMVHMYTRSVLYECVFQHAP